MTEIVNLKRVRKAKARAEKDKVAEANRTLFGTPRKVRDLARAKAEKELSALKSKKLDGEK